MSLSRISLIALGALAVFGAVKANAPAGAQAVEPSPSVAEAIDRTLRDNIFDPAVLDTPAYAAVRDAAPGLERENPDPQAFARAYNSLWRKGPTSHVRVATARADAEATAEMLDAMKAGPDALTLEWKGDVAILTLNTMMGVDTVGRVHAAMAEISARPARGLIVDLRANEGGAFAGVALMSHLVDRLYEAGAFFSRKWTAANRLPPVRSAAIQLPAWSGWSIRTFWKDVTAQPVTRIQFQPQAPYYDGPVFVLTSKTTASAAEFTADALAGSGRAVLVGERTAGEMLSQKPFDLPRGLQLFLPVANYVSWHSGVIEGHGVAPAVEVTADAALPRALAMLDERAPVDQAAIGPARATFEQWAAAFRSSDYLRQWALTDPRIRYWISDRRWLRGMRRAAQLRGALIESTIVGAMPAKGEDIPCTEQGHCFRTGVEYVLFLIRSRYAGRTQPPQPEYAVMAKSEEGWRFAGGTFPFRPLGETAVLLNETDEARYRNARRMTPR